MSIEAGQDIVLGPPPIPNLVMAPPQLGLVIVPVQGPTGPKGDTGSAAAQGYGPVSVTNQALVQINHGLTFQPAGVVCIDSNGVTTDYGAIYYPMSGTVEITFGFPFTGDIWLS